MPVRAESGLNALKTNTRPMSRSSKTSGKTRQGCGSSARCKWRLPTDGLAKALNRLLSRRAVALVPSVGSAGRRQYSHCNGRSKSCQ